MGENACALSRALAARGAVVQAQILEAFLRGKHYRHIVARADRFGLPLALLYKVTRGRRDLVLVSAWLSRPKKAVFLSRLHVQSHLGAIINYSSVQAEAALRFGVPPEKVHVILHPVDERFWRPTDEATERCVLAVGSEARDYPTFVRAIDGLDVTADVAVGSSMLKTSGDADAMFGPLLRGARDAGTDTPRTSVTRLRLHQQLSHDQLRALYSRARLVVVPLQDVDFDAGVTTITEAMAMGKPVVVTRSRGQVDVVRHGENGLYVPPQDPDALRSAVRRVLDNPAEAHQMGRAGRRLVEERHTLDGWVSAVARVVAETHVPSG
jgi:glycosyltransferase involved in cell wall biosynthesis